MVNIKNTALSTEMTSIKLIAALLLTTFSISTYGQQYLLTNEKVVYSFTTTNNKKVVLARDKENKYLVYRFGTQSKIELEYPKMHVNSWRKFNYSYWLRGGGVINEGIDLNYVYFTIDNYRYVLYDTYFAVGKSAIGLYVIDLGNNKRIDIRGVRKTENGNLTVFRNNSLISKGEELFD